MSDISKPGSISHPLGTGPVMNVVPFARPSQVRRENTDRIGKRRVSARDHDNVEAAARAVLSSVSNAMDDPEEKDLVSYILDDKYDGERSLEEQESLRRFFDAMRFVVMAKQEDGQRTVIFKATIFGAVAEGGDMRPVTSVYVRKEDGNDEVLISRDLGFRDAILASQAAFSDFMVKAARESGVIVPEGDVGMRLHEAIAYGVIPDFETESVAPEAVAIPIAGEVIVHGIPRYQTE